MSTKQRAELWRRKRRNRRIIWSIVAVIVIVAGSVFIRMTRPQTMTTEPTASSPPVTATATPTPTVELDLSAAALSERAKEFAVIYYSFDGSNPNHREKALSEFMDKETLQKLLKAEHSLPPYEILVKKKVVRTARVVSDPDLSLAGDDLAYVSVDVEIVSTDADPGSEPETITSETQWVLPAGGLWEVVSVELIEEEP